MARCADCVSGRVKVKTKAPSPGREPDESMRLLANSCDGVAGVCGVGLPAVPGRRDALRQYKAGHWETAVRETPHAAGLGSPMRSCRMRVEGPTTRDPRTFKRGDPNLYKEHVGGREGILDEDRGPWPHREHLADIGGLREDRDQWIQTAVYRVRVVRARARS